jgi:hypothetical protein
MDPHLMENNAAAMREDLWRTLQVVSEWIKVADTKAGACVAIDGALLALLAGQLRTGSDPQIVEIVMLAIAVILAAASGLVGVWAVLPRARRYGVHSIAHYGTIATFDSAASYQDAAVDIFSDPDDFAKSLAAHIWALSRVAMRKYILVTWTIALLVAAAAAAGTAQLPW